jgi:hypothetical protein
MNDEKSALEVIVEDFTRAREIFDSFAKLKPNVEEPESHPEDDEWGWDDEWNLHFEAEEMYALLRRADAKVYIIRENLGPIDERYEDLYQLHKDLISSCNWIKKKFGI